MKDKVLIFIIGVLVGAIIATSCFFVYYKFFRNEESQQLDRGTMQMDGEQDSEMGNPPDMTEGSEDGEPPERPDGDMGEVPSDMGSGTDSSTTDL